MSGCSLCIWKILCVLVDVWVILWWLKYMDMFICFSRVFCESMMWLIRSLLLCSSRLMDWVGSMCLVWDLFVSIEFWGTSILMLMRTRSNVCRFLVLIIDFFIFDLFELFVGSGELYSLFWSLLNEICLDFLLFCWVWKLSNLFEGYYVEFVVGSGNCGSCCK